MRLAPLAVACAVLSACPRAEPPPASPVAPSPRLAEPGLAEEAPAPPMVVFETQAGDVPVFVEVARTEEQRRVGLMHRRHLEPGHGMLFLMDDERTQVFWMRNTLIPLDMIFINEALEVVGIVENAEPLTETPRGVRAPSRYVVEISGGHARLSGIAPGDRMRVGDIDLPR